MIKFLLLAAFCICFVAADIPVHCVFDQVVGTWKFSLGVNSYSNNITCDSHFPVAKTYIVSLQEPNIAVDQSGNTGTWTLIYDEGFEVSINNQKFFAFFEYETVDKKVISHCDRTQVGWYHNAPVRAGVLPTNWGCYVGNKASSEKSVSMTNEYVVEPSKMEVYSKQRWVADEAMVEHINKQQTTWTATVYPSYSEKTVAQMLKMAGRQVPKIKRRERPAAIPNEIAKLSGQLSGISLPTNFDWRNVSGQNYDSPMRDQLNCGSCYAHGGVEMLESRTRILTGNKDRVLLSVQDVVSCSKYSQGCNGGFSFLVSKYGEDFGIVTESCFPYQSGLRSDVQCAEKCADAANPKNNRKVTNYYYVGGFYGGCSEIAMMEEIYRNGPVSVEMQVYQDFTNYRGGIYHHVESSDAIAVNPWEETNHEVLLLGWGEENGVKYWIGRNSWGFRFGERGYFRIRRGNDECAIESAASAATPVIA